jgi:ankyrin repeat protein
VKVSRSDAGANVHAVDELALWLAAKNGHTDTVRVLLDGGADVHEDEDWVLVLAAENGHTETVRALLKAGATGRDYSFLDARLPPSPRIRRTGATPRPSRF